MTGIRRISRRSAHDAVDDRLNAGFGQCSGLRSISASETQRSMTEQFDLNVPSCTQPDLAGKPGSHNALKIAGYKDAS